MTANDASPTVLISEESLEERMNWRWSERDFDADATDEQQVEQGRMPGALRRVIDTCPSDQERLGSSTSDRHA